MRTIHDWIPELNERGATFHCMSDGKARQIRSAAVQVNTEGESLTARLDSSIVLFPFSRLHVCRAEDGTVHVFPQGRLEKDELDQALMFICS